jgi:hypothetical protein
MAKPKGDLIGSRVFEADRRFKRPPSKPCEVFMESMRALHPDATIKRHRRVVKADYVWIHVDVVVVRRKLTPLSEIGD